MQPRPLDTSESKRLAALDAALPPVALTTLEVLEGGGFEAWCVGGFVRDALLGRSVHDVDVATIARWQEAQRLLEEAGSSPTRRAWPTARSPWWWAESPSR